jgi:hypothetical protein
MQDPVRKALVLLPIIPAGTETILEVMKVIDIPYNDFSSGYLCNELGGRVAVTTYLQILKNTEWSTSRCVKKPKCNSKFLTVVRQMKHLFFFIYIM